MSLLDQIAGAVAQVQGNADLNAVRFRHTATWSDGTTCRFGVQDPNRGKDVRNIVTNPEQASLRVLRVHHDDPQPALAASTAWEGGTLVRGQPTDVSDSTGQVAFSCRQVDPRYYPDHVTREDAPSVQLRIVARGALPFSVGSGLQDVQGAPVSSHLGFVEPGVKLRGGEVLTLPRGDRFVVVPPLQHDVLGDTVGLSWQGDTSVPNLTPDPTPDPAGTPKPLPGDDSFWHTR